VTDLCRRLDGTLLEQLDALEAALDTLPLDRRVGVRHD